ncbi:TPA: hypothetical protein ACF2DJ_003459 [Clostridium perfringens]|uniref:hypothetical protein n=1 Tax=Clostridium perfringens TaxID=1502 RepID=UPI003654FAEE
MYQYKMKLVFGNREFNISSLKQLLNECKDLYNLRSATAKNKKKISDLSILDENILFVTLNSDVELIQPLKGMYLFSKLLLEKLSQEQKDNIIRNKSVFKILNYDKTFIAGSDLDLKVKELPSVEELLEIIEKMDKRLNILEEKLDSIK